MKNKKCFDKRVAKLFLRDKFRYKFDLLKEKQIEILKINKNAENGRVLIVFGRRDCDGSQSDGYTALVDACYYSTQKLINDIRDGADGAFWYDYAKPSEESDIIVESRDLALEAFENGHNHIIYA